MSKKINYAQPAEMEMLQLTGNLDELNNLLEKWTTGNITDKEFALKARDLIAFLKAVASEISKTIGGLLDEVKK